MSTASKTPAIGHQRPDLSDLLSRYSINKPKLPQTEAKIDKKSIVDEVEKEMTIDYLDRRLAAKDPTLTMFASRPTSRAASRAGSRMGSPADNTDEIDLSNAFKPTNRSKKADRELERHESKISDIRKLKSSAEDFIQAAKERAFARNNLLSGGDVDPEKAEMEKRAMTPYDKTRKEFADRRAKELAEKSLYQKYQSYSDNEFDDNSDEEDEYLDKRPSTNMGFYEKNSSPPDRSRDRRGSYSRPSSRQDHHRPSSRQDHYRDRRPTSRQGYHDRPSSRQDHCDRPSSRQDYRPSSRQDYSDYSDEENERGYGDRRRGSRRNGNVDNRSKSSRHTYPDESPVMDRRCSSRAMRHEDLRGASPRSASRSLRYEDLKTGSSPPGSNGDRSRTKNRTAEREKRSSSRASVAFDEEEFRNSLYNKGPQKSEKPRAKKYTPSRRSHYPSDDSDGDDSDDVSLDRFDVNDDVNSLHSTSSGKRSSAKSKIDDAEITSLHSRSKRPTSSAKASAVVNSDSGEASDDMNLDSLITRYLFKK